MATINIYHGGPDFNPGAVLVDALLNWTLSTLNSTDYTLSVFGGDSVDFTGSLVVALPPAGTVTGFKVLTAADPTLPPLMAATGYDIDVRSALVPAISAYHHTGDAALLNALLDVPTTYNGSPDADFIFDITSLGSRIYGNAGNDTLLGGRGKDLLFGGPGADHFEFIAVSDSVVGPHRDIIEDFSHAEGDKIDLALIDANTRVPGDQAFKFIGSDTFAHYHSLHHSLLGMVRYSGGIIQGNVNANLAPDFEIAVKSATALTAHDFIL